MSKVTMGDVYALVGAVRFDVNDRQNLWKNVEASVKYAVDWLKSKGIDVVVYEEEEISSCCGATVFVVPDGTRSGQLVCSQCRNPCEEI